MFERFTERARQVVVLAQDEARTTTWRARSVNLSNMLVPPFCRS